VRRITPTMPPNFFEGSPSSGSTRQIIDRHPRKFLAIPYNTTAITTVT
jgi:hypothetical protein